MECPAADIPESIEVNVNEMKLGDSIGVAQLEVPGGATVLDEMEATVVHCIEPPVEAIEEEEVAEATAGEPEVIGEKEDEGGEDEGESEG
jgi:large subunit ribosomal protein L25